MKLWYIAGQVASFFITLFRLLPLKVSNSLRIRSPRIPQEGDIVISMTTHGKRLNKVFYAIESLARGTVRVPIVLWLDAPDFDRPWPRSLRRLVKRGLQVRCSDGLYGPHTKYWPMFREVHGTDKRVATADDDIIYPIWWLDRLVETQSHRPEVVVCYRAHRVEMRDGEMLPYAKWGSVDNCRPSYLHFATGVSGVLYPTVAIDALVAAGDEFQEVTPKADDIWLHAVEIRNGIKVRQVFGYSRNFAVVPSTQLNGLIMLNLLRGGNDAQMQQVYTAEDKALLQEAAKSED